MTELGSKPPTEALTLEKSLMPALCCLHLVLGYQPCPIEAGAAAAESRFPCQGSHSGVTKARRICMLWLNPPGHGEAPAGPSPELPRGCTRLFLLSRALLLAWKNQQQLKNDRGHTPALEEQA